MDCETLKCHHCSAEAGTTAAIYSLESGVTSDCRPWNEKVRIFVCPFLQRGAGANQRSMAWERGKNLP